LLRTVVERHRERSRALPGALERIFQHRHNIGLHNLVIADNLEADALLNEILEIGPDEPPHEVHQVTDLLLAALPVLRRERVEREALDPEPGTGLDRAADGLATLLVPDRARQVALLRPPPVAVHDDRHTARAMRHPMPQ